MQEEPISAAPPPKLRWYQYRLRSLLILMTLVAVFFSWFGNRLRIAHSQQAAVEKLHQNNAMVMYDDQKKWPAWLEKLLGKDFCYRVKSIIIMNPEKDQFKELEHILNYRVLSIGEGKVTAEDFEHIKANTALQKLLLEADFPLDKIRQIKSLDGISLSGKNLTDETLESLDGLDNLQSLDIHSDAITDRGLAKIKNLLNLKGFVLNSKSVTGGGLAFFKSAKNLKAVDFFDTPVTDEMMEFLRDCKDLECLVVQRAGSITDKGMSCLQDHAKLEQVCIYQPSVPITGKGLSSFANCESLVLLSIGSNAAIEDEDLKSLRSCKQMKYLSLINSKITEKGLKHLADMKELISLGLPGSDFNDEGIDQLNQIAAKEICIGGKNLTDAGIEKLRTNNISRLELNKTGITDKSLPHLAQIQELETLSLQDTAVTFEGLKQLAGLRKLKCLFISGTPAAEHLLNNPNDLNALESLLSYLQIECTKQ